MAKFLYLRIPTQNSRLKAQSSGLSGLGVRSEELGTYSRNSTQNSKNFVPSYSCSYSTLNTQNSKLQLVRIRDLWPEKEKISLLRMMVILTINQKQFSQMSRKGTKTAKKGGHQPPSLFITPNS
jgi:hypothetical protein